MIRRFRSGVPKQIPGATLIRSSSHRWHTHGRYAGANVVDELAERGIPTYVGTVNDVTMAQELKGRGFGVSSVIDPVRCGRRLMH